MCIVVREILLIVVALLAEGVDRNLSVRSGHRRYRVALLAEGVDRNRTTAMRRSSLKVALLAEGVDRNPSDMSLSVELTKSPSSRRAWIEISGCQHQAAAGFVALLAEGVDRNWSTRKAS